MAVPARRLEALKLHVRESLIAHIVQLPVQEFIYTAPSRRERLNQKVDSLLHPKVQDSAQSGSVK